MSSWNDFNDAQAQTFDLVPKGTIARVRLAIRPGGHRSGVRDGQQGGRVDDHVIIALTDLVQQRRGCARRSPIAWAST